MNDRLRRCDFVQQNHTPHPALRATFSSRRRLGLVRICTAKQQFTFSIHSSLGALKQVCDALPQSLSLGGVCGAFPVDPFDGSGLGVLQGL